MKSILYKVACVATLLSSPLTASSQYYYVVVGAFAGDENASELKDYLPAQFLDSAYTVPAKDNLLHLYVLKTTDKESAISKTLLLKKGIESFSSPRISAIENNLAGGIVGKEVPPEATPEKASPVIESVTASASSPADAPNMGDTPPKPAGKYFKFQIESPEGEFIAGKVHHVDLARGRELATYKSDTFVDLLRPGENTEPMTVVCGMFGYKEIYKYVDYADPSLTDDQAYVDAEGAWVIPYRLERLEKGDVSIMYNVSFYKDAAIMRKASEKDLDELVRMMQTNPYYEITIHAYCNGKKKRDIIALGPNKNYFDVAGSITLAGSAKDLTDLRGGAIKSYLVDHGINDQRIKIFSWGGSDMLVKSDSPDARLNDRIEIEITRD